MSYPANVTVIYITTLILLKPLKQFDNEKTKHYWKDSGKYDINFCINNFVPCGRWRETKIGPKRMFHAKHGNF